MSYEGSKWQYAGVNEYCDKNKTIHKYNDYGFKVTENVFKMTPGYKKYLANKNAYEEYKDFQILKNKIEYQMKHYGEADEYDIAELLKMAQRLFPNGGAFYQHLFTTDGLQPIIHHK